MQSSRSHISLRDLPAGLEGLHLDTRTASSTPAARHRSDLSMSKASLPTPPADASVSETFPAGRRNRSSERSILLESNVEDDVFAADAGARIPSSPTAPASTATESSPVNPETALAVYASPSNKPQPRADRLTEPITPQNAQGVLPPEACVFVANLSVSKTDQELELSVYSQFKGFGNCTLKVRRDRHRHPFALVQFYTVESAQQAIEGGRDMVIDGRKIRTEPADVRRSVVLSRVTGGPISKEEATELLSQYGPIQEMQPTTHADARLHEVPEGMWVKFAYFLDFKDALEKFNKNNDLFKIIEPRNVDSRMSQRTFVNSSPTAQTQRTPRSSTDQKSIFVGNLPHDIDETELREIFSAYGEIKGCNVIRKPITGGQGYNVFGFIEFSTTSEADRAAENEVDIRGQRIRVEPKEYSARRHTRLQTYAEPPPARVPRAITWGPSNSYQPPGAHPYGFQPMFFPQPGGMTGFPAYGYAATPPNSGHRRNGQTGDEFAFAGSLYQGPPLIPFPPPAYSMAPRDGEQDENLAQLRQWR